MAKDQLRNNIVVYLKSELACEDALVAFGKDCCEHRCGRRAMGIDCFARCDGKAPVVGDEKLWKESTCCCDRTEISQAQFFDKAILQAAVCAFEAVLFLRRIRADQFDVEFT